MEAFSPHPTSPRSRPAVFSEPLQGCLLMQVLLPQDPRRSFSAAAPTSRWQIFIARSASIQKRHDAELQQLREQAAADDTFGFSDGELDVGGSQPTAEAEGLSVLPPMLLGPDALGHAPWARAWSNRARQAAVGVDLTGGASSRISRDALPQANAPEFS